MPSGLLLPPGGHFMRLDSIVELYLELLSLGSRPIANFCMVSKSWILEYSLSTANMIVGLLTPNCATTVLM